MILTFYLERPRLSETPFFKFSLLPASLKLPQTIYAQSALPTERYGQPVFIQPRMGR